VECRREGRERERGATDGRRAWLGDRNSNSRPRYYRPPVFPLVKQSRRLEFCARQRGAGGGGKKASVCSLGTKSSLSRTFFLGTTKRPQPSSNDQPIIPGGRYISRRSSSTLRFRSRLHGDTLEHMRAPA
jgi:hypothetical protein